MKINPKVNHLIKIIGKECRRLGINAYLVGGPVRDLLLGESNIDLDIAVDKDIEKLVEALAKRLKAEFVYHRQFKTATLFLDNLNIDIATTREEIYPSYGVLPRVSEASLESDLFRRDFTINAMAIQINSTGLGTIVDPYNGRRDLKNKKISILHNKSFLDDPTRVLRAIRFLTRLNFSFEPHTLALLKEAVDQNIFSKVSASRIGNEVIKLLQEKSPFKTLRQLNRICGLSFIHPKIKFSPRWNSVFREINKYVLNFKKLSHKNIEPWIIYFVSLTENLNREELAQLCQNYELRRTPREIVLHTHDLRNLINVQMVEKDEPSSFYRRLKPIFPEAVIYLVAHLASFRAKKKLFNFLVRLDKIKVKLDGEGLKKMGFIPGPVFNKILDSVFLAKLDGRISSEQQEIDFVQENFKQKL